VIPTRNRKLGSTTHSTPEWVTSTRADRKAVESVSGGWQVVASPPARMHCFTDFTNKVMSVPDGDTELDKAVRLHELLHARLSPAFMPPEFYEYYAVSRTSIAVAEEMRLHTVVENSMNPDDAKLYYEHLADGTEAASADAVVERSSWREAVYLMASVYGTKSYRTVKRRLRLDKSWRDDIGRIDKVLRHAAHLYYDHYLVRSTTPIGVTFTTSRGKVIESVQPRGFMETTLNVAILLERLTEQPPRESKGEKEKAPSRPAESNEPMSSNRWYPLSVGSTVLSEPTATFVGRKKSASVMGKVIKYPHRLLTDPECRVFSTMTRGISGVVVVDCSGSMSLTRDELDGILQHSPGCTVIAYSHRREGQSNTYILAKNGKKVSDKQLDKIRLGSGNGVDFPAIEWGLKHRVRKTDFALWITDGMVTGHRDYYHPDLALECAEFATKHRITVAENVEQATAMLADLKRGKPLPRTIGEHLQNVLDHHKGSN
jgi:hypothetical protein